MLIQCNLQNGRWHSYDNVKMQRALKIEICTISPAPIELLHTYRPPPLPSHTLQSWHSFEDCELVENLKVRISFDLQL